MHARQAVLVFSNDTWVKNTDDTSFDVKWAELYELVGLYIIYEIDGKFNLATIGLYCDDGSACFHNVSGPVTD